MGDLEGISVKVRKTYFGDVDTQSINVRQIEVSKFWTGTRER